MPYLRVQSNTTIADPNAFLRDASEFVSRLLGKPETYVMVALDPTVPMSFAGSNDPALYLQLKSIGLPESRTKELSAALCDFAEARLSVPKERVYIEFTDAPRAFWGWNGSTF